MKNKIERTLAFGLLLVLMFPAIAIIPAQEVASEPYDPDIGMAEINLSVTGTFLLAEPYYGGGGSIDPPAIVHLQSLGVAPLDNIMISYEGQIDRYGGWNPDDAVYVDVARLAGVFSTSSELLPIDTLHRVPGAIDAGADEDTGETNFDHISTDIPEDFRIAPSSGLWMQVPRNAEYLFICFVDSYYYDNLGSIRVTIEKDTDGDGLLDSWELAGIDVDKDGSVDLDLPGLGANYEHKDIFVEADYMSGRAPNQAAIEDVKNAFANAPVPNPDGVDGISLHVIIGESLPAIGLLGSFDDFYIYKAGNFGTENERSNPQAIEAKKLAFRYCIFANKIWPNAPDYDCPGVAEVLGDDFVLAFGALAEGGTREEQAAIFMHELGHTLGLRHGGDVNVNYKPNYLSIMNYAFQYNILVPTRPLDYSHGICIDLNETDLDENMGIGASKVTVWRGPDGRLYRSAGALAINWNSNNLTEAGVQVNLNDRSNATSPANEVLTDYDDWANLVYRFRGTRLYLESASPDDYHAELTARQIELMGEEAANIIVVNSPDDSAGLSTEIVLGIVTVAVMATIVAVFFFMRRKKA